ncbi:FAD-dependent oxidoreductase [Kitasatospora sp. MBT63]|uniref:FAD-dependent oxidoreductase n=1 Tax=Kitasatospora sp. MBT63 TaxID=1444768 RepID=UPI0009E9115F|nr:FAD-dependent oxidoreductase [Kitasatospora sp. MBT63]
MTAPLRGRPGPVSGGPDLGPGPGTQVLRVAVVGSGPAGLYTAEALVKQTAQAAQAADGAAVRVTVDVLDRLPTPYGLVRYGVAPDHPSIRSIADYLRRVLEDPRVRFLGGLRLGGEVTREMLLSCYDAVVYATGAPLDRRLGVPGEELPGSAAAADFVRWYCGHPDADPGRFALDAVSVAVIGAGNVALDVARVLARPAADFGPTDVPDPVLAALAASRVREIHVISRRGPAEARFTTKELRELGGLPGVDIAVDASPGHLAGAFPGDAGASPGDGVRPPGADPADRRVRGNLAVVADWAARGPHGGGRRVCFRFWRRPVEILGPGRVTALRLERTAPGAAGGAVGTGVYDVLPVQLVLRSVGYRSAPLAGVPFDERRAVVPNAEGRVLGADGRPRPGEYVAGWLKRGPSGVIGTNKADAAQTVRSLLADRLPGGAPPHHADPGAPPLAERLAARGVRPVTYAEWLGIDEREHRTAAALGRGERVKLSGWDALNTAGGHPRSG